MKAFHVRALTFGLFTAIIVGAFVLNAFIPSIPGLAYAAVSIVLGATVLVAIGKTVRNQGIVLSDERTAANLAKASLDTWRVSYIAMMAFVLAVFNISPIGAEWLSAGHAVLVVMVAQAWLLLAFKAFHDRKN